MNTLLRVVPRHEPRSKLTQADLERMRRDRDQLWRQIAADMRRLHALNLSIDAGEARERAGALRGES